MPLMGARWLQSLATGTLGTLTSSMITCGVNGNTGETLQCRLTARKRGTESHVVYCNTYMCDTLTQMKIYMAEVHTSS